MERDGDYEFVPAALQQTTALNMIRDRASNIWIAAIPWTPAPEPHGWLQSASEAGWNVATVFEDRDGTVRRHRSRVERWRDPVFTTYSAAQGMPADAAGPLCWTSPGEYGSGHPAEDCSGSGNGVVTEARHAGLADDAKNLITARRRTAGRQATRWRDAAPSHGDAIEAERYTQRQGLTQNSVFAIHRSRDGAVWAGTLSGGASLFTGDG